MNTEQSKLPYLNEHRTVKVTMDSWPPHSLDAMKYHIIVEIGVPLTRHQRCIKLAVFLNRTLSNDKNLWRYYLPESDSPCGAIFTTDNQMDYEMELQVVYDIKFGTNDFDSASVRCPLGDDMAYTKLKLLEPHPKTSLVSDSKSGSEDTLHRPTSNL